MKVITTEIEGNIAIVTLNRPNRGNALNEELGEQLLMAIEKISGNPVVRVLIITGAGKSFSTGGDMRTDEERLKLIEGSAVDFYYGYKSRVKKIIGGLHNLSIPTIAMVNGDAVGFGAAIALACDMRIGSENARFYEAWVKLGFLPAAGSVWFLPRIIGIGRALELLLTARFVGAEEAEKIGLLNKVVAAAELKVETMNFAKKIASLPPLAIQMTKLNVYRGLDVDLSSCLDLSGALQSILASSQDNDEAMAAFREKRKGVYKGK